MFPVAGLFLSLLLQAPAGAGSEKWIQVQSDTFVVKSSSGERAKRVLRELEAFHQLIGAAMVFRKVQLPELPIEVLIAGDDAQMAELAPLYEGRKMPVAGYYQRGQDRDFIVLSGDGDGNLTRLVYHELTHYFLSRSLESRPTWLNEGLAEYFATADIDGETIYLGELSSQRLDLLKRGRLLPLREFFAVDDRSPFYNETLKANVFYAQAWAFVHFLTHGRYRDQFRLYVEALAHGEVRFSDHIATDLKTLEAEFDQYLKVRMRLTSRDRLKADPDAWSMKIQPISAADVEMTITEIFMSSGRFKEARQHLEKVTGMDDEFPRAAYYRAVLARISGEGDPREFFIDALMDQHLGPRAAVNLVQLGELSIPAARRALEQAAAAGTHMSDVYWALTEIHLAEARQAQENMRLPHERSAVPARTPSRAAEPLAEVVMSEYAAGSGDHFRYQLLSDSASGPRVETVVPPFFPPELLDDRLVGKVVLDIQIAESGEVGGIWLISASPDVFGGLAVSAVRDWKFEPVSRKVRVILEFVP